jgi:carbamoyltransferase
MVEAERITRSKRAWRASPAPAIDECLNCAGITWSDLTAVAVGWDVPELMKMRGLVYSDQTFKRWLRDASADPAVIFGGNAGGPQSFRDEGGPQIVFVPHHLAHAVSGFHFSGLQDAAVVVADGTGETEAVTLWHARSGELAPLSQWPNSKSLGRYYGNAAEWAGLGYFDGGKLMGLASYGAADQPVPLVDRDGDILFEDAEGKPLAEQLPGPGDGGQWLRGQLSAYFDHCCYPYVRGEGSEIMAYSGFAASVQKSLERTMLGLCRRACALAGSRALVLAGGVAANCSMTGQLLRSGEFATVYVPPFPYDAGVAVGAAVHVARRFQPEPPESTLLTTAALGPAEPGQRIQVQHDAFACRELEPADLPRHVARLIADGNVVCWFQGRAEVGQRALGGRSILADPRVRANVARVNQLKGREIWRPLAPSVHEDGWDLLFDCPVHAVHTFMLAAEPVRPAWRARVPAIVHIDGTARPQIVRASTHPLYAGLIKEFWELTGVPAVLNTSFNLAGEPMVYSERDALEVFDRSGFDALVVGSSVITRRPGTEAPPPPG